MHGALAKEIEICKEELHSGIAELDLKGRWNKMFMSCFNKLDNEVGGFARVNGDIVSDLLIAPKAPESVGSTAVVALVCSTHIIVANCGDSRAVLCRGKVPMPLSVDHKVRLLILVIT